MTEDLPQPLPPQFFLNRRPWFQLQVRHFPLMIALQPYRITRKITRPLGRFLGGEFLHTKGVTRKGNGDVGKISSKSLHLWRVSRRLQQLGNSSEAVCDLTSQGVCYFAFYTAIAMTCLTEQRCSSVLTRTQCLGQ